MKKPSLKAAIKLMRIADTELLHNPADYEIMTEGVDEEFNHYTHYKRKSLEELTGETPLLMTAESIEANREFSYHCSDCGFPKFCNDDGRTEACRMCGD